MGYGKQTEYTTGGLSDTFQTTRVDKVIFALTTGGLCVIIHFKIDQFDF